MAAKLAIDVNILESSGSALLLNDESLWDLAKSAESRTLARATATKWTQLYRDDGKELFAAVATLRGQPGNVPHGGLKCREFLAAVATLSSELAERDTQASRVAVRQAAVATAHKGSRSKGSST